MVALAMSDIEDDEQPLKRSLSRQDDDLADLFDRPDPKGINDLVRYDHGQSRWHYWDRHRWRVDGTEHVFEMVRQKATTWIERTTSQAKAKELLPLLNLAKKRSVLESLAFRPGIAMEGDEWDQVSNLIGCPNGVLNLDTLEFHPEAHPEWLITRSTRPAWDPNASCPLFEKFVSEIVGGDEELMMYLLTVLGYAMFGHQREQKFWMWVGQGNNGKGTLAKIVSWVLKDYAYTPSNQLYMKTRHGNPSSAAARPDLVRLLGVRWTWMSEPQGGAFNDEMVKAHTGDDPIEARDLYSKAKNVLNWRPTHTITFLTNDPPRTEDVGMSMRRRARVIRFEQDFSGERMDKDLEQKLRAEAPGILRLLATMAAHYAQAGLVEPVKVTEWSNEYIEENDPLATFIQEACVVEKDAKVSATLLYEGYVEWGTRRNQEHVSQTGFGLMMRRRFERIRSMSGNVYLGIGLKSAMRLAEDETDDDA